MLYLNSKDFPDVFRLTSRIDEITIVASQSSHNVGTCILNWPNAKTLKEREIHIREEFGKGNVSAQYTHVKSTNSISWNTNFVVYDGARLSAVVSPPVPAAVCLEDFGDFFATKASVAGLVACLARTLLPGGTFIAEYLDPSGLIQCHRDGEWGGMSVPHVGDTAAPYGARVVIKQAASVATYLVNLPALREHCEAAGLTMTASLLADVYTLTKDTLDASCATDGQTRYLAKVRKTGFTGAAGMVDGKDFRVFGLFGGIVITKPAGAGPSG